jgi:hypothetical protein
MVFKRNPLFVCRPTIRGVPGERQRRGDIARLYNVIK